MKFLAGLLAIISSFFAGDSSLESSPPPLNYATVAYHQTYFAPAVAEPGNFPWAKKISVSTNNVSAPTVKVTPPPPPASAPAPVPAAPAPAPTIDVYLVNPEPVVDWYVPTTFRGNSNESNNVIPEMTFSREFWRIEALAYWAPGNSSRPSVEKDYFKLEVYEKGTDKLIYTMASGTDESIHKFQAFKKPGTYYFKIYLKAPSQYEIAFTFH